MKKTLAKNLHRKKINEINNYLIKEIDQSELLSNKSKKVCATLNYIEYFLSSVFAVTVCISISAFASLGNISKEILSSTIVLHICAIITRIKKYKSMIMKKKKKHDEIAR